MSVWRLGYSELLMPVNPKANKSVITLAKINIPDHEGKLYSYHPLETRKKLFGMQGILIICIQIL